MFATLVRVVQKRTKVQVIGTTKDVDRFTKLLIVSTKMKKWRTFILPIVRMLKKGVLHLPNLILRGNKLTLRKGIDRSWAIYTQDERLCLALDKVAAKKVHYIGTARELVEFICRFLLTELLQDWRGPKMMLATESVKRKSVRLERLNALLALWDFTSIFEKK